MTAPTPAVPGAINVSVLTGSEIIPIATGGPQSAQTTAQAIADLTQSPAGTANFTALTTTSIHTLSTVAFTGLDVSGVATLTTADFGALTTTSIHTLSTAQLTALTVTGLAALTTGNISAMTTTSIAAITNTTTVPAITSTQLNGLTTTQMGGLNTTQLIALSSILMPRSPTF